MQVSILVGAAALVLAEALAAGQAFGQDSSRASVVTAQEKVDQREAERRIALAEHQKRKEDFARRCIKTGLSDTELEACRIAYRAL